MQFPALKTGAVMQYPVRTLLAQNTTVLRFLDGDEQSYLEQPAPLRRWVVALNLIDDTEAAAIEDFFASAEGRLGSFSFTDPSDGATYDNCSIDDDSLELRWSEEGRIAATLTIRQNRG
jgi:hypothetical protein